MLAKGSERLGFLKLATKLDPGAWAHNSALAVALTLEPLARATCAEDIALLLRTIVNLSYLTVNDTQLSRLLSRLVGQPENDRMAVLKGMIEERSARPEDALATYLEALPKVQRSPCSEPLRLTLESRINALKTGEQNR